MSVRVTFGPSWKRPYWPPTRNDRITPARIESAFAEAVISDLAELRGTFERAKPLVGEVPRNAVSAASSASRSGSP